MASRIEPRDVLEDIEFELIQGALRRDELGQSIQAVRKFHGELRGELLAAVADLEGGRALVSRQAQFNDMVLTLLQEMGNELARMERRQRRLDARAQAQPAREPAPAGPRGDAAESGESEAPAAWLDPAPTPSGDPWTSATVPIQQIEEAGRREFLRVETMVRPVGLPLLGGLLLRLRRTLHGLVTYYVARLADRQAEINRLFSQKLVELSLSEAASRRQLEALAAEVQRLRADDRE